MKGLSGIFNGKEFKQKLMVSLAIIVFAGIIIYTFLHFGQAENKTEFLSPYVENCAFTSELVEGMVIEQSFRTSLDVIDGIYLETATFARQNTSYINITLLDDKNQQLYSERFSLESAIDNQFSFFEFEESINVMPDEELVLHITSEENAGGNGICLVYSTTDSYTNGDLWLNGEKQEGDCFFGFSGYEYNNTFSTLNIIGSIILLLFTSVGVVLIIFKKNKADEKVIPYINVTRIHLLKIVLLLCTVIFVGKTDYYVVKSIMEREENSYIVHIENQEEVRVDDTGVDVEFINHAKNILSNNIMIINNDTYRGIVKYSVCDVEENQIADGYYDLNDVVRPYNDAWDELSIDCSDYNLIQGGKYVITLKFIDTNPLYIISNQEGQIQQRQIMSFSYKNIYILAVILVSLTVLIAIAYALVLEFSNKVFLITALALGFLACFIETPCSADDEFRHFLRAYDWADNSIFVEHLEEFSHAKGNVIIEDDGKACLINVPAQINGLRLLDKSANYDNISYDAEMNYNGCIDELYRLSSYDGNERTYVSIAGTYEANLITYLPQVIFICIGKLLGMNGVGLFYMSRIGNMLIATFLTYLAAYLVPRYRNVLYALHFAPNALWIRSSCNRDALVTAAVLIIIAYILYIKENKLRLLQFNRMILLGVLTILVAILKLPYVLAIGFVIVLNADNFNNLKAKYCFWVKTGVIIFLVCIGMLGYQVSLCTSNEQKVEMEQEIADINQENTNEVTHIGYAMLYPQKVIFKILDRFSSFKEDVYRAVEGYKFPYTNKYLFMTAIIIIMAGKSLNIKEKVWSLFVFFGIWISIIAAGYTMAAPDIDFIWGVNPRYMIPILPLLGLAFSFGNERTDKVCNLIVPTWMLTITAMGMISLIPVYW